VVVQSICHGDKQTMPDMQQIMDHGTISPLTATVLGLLTEGGEKETITIQTSGNEVGLMFRSAFPEDLEWDTRAEDVALSLDAIKRCLTNMLVALDRDTPQMKGGISLPLICTAQELLMAQEPPWLWFTLPELGFPMLMDEYRRPINPEIEEFMRRYVTNDQDWEKVDDEDCWGGTIQNPRHRSRRRLNRSSTHGVGNTPGRNRTK